MTSKSKALSFQHECHKAAFELISSGLDMEEAAKLDGVDLNKAQIERVIKFYKNGIVKLSIGIDS